VVTLDRPLRITVYAAQAGRPAIGFVLWARAMTR
jgi:hypothetical protein